LFEIAKMMRPKLNWFYRVMQEDLISRVYPIIFNWWALMYVRCSVFNKRVKTKLNQLNDELTSRSLNSLN